MPSCKVCYLGVLLALTACSASSEKTQDSGQPDLDNDAGGRGPAATPRWFEQLSASSARLVARPDGGAVVVTTTDTETRVRSFDPNGDERWSYGLDSTPFNLPWGAPELAVGPMGDTYLSISVSPEQRAVLGDRAAECSDGCSAVASFDPEGALRWITPMLRRQSRYLAAVEDGVVVAGIDVGPPSTLTLLSTAGEVAWEQPWQFDDFWKAVIAGDAFIAGDGADGFYVASTARTDGGAAGSVCAVIARHRASDGAESWHEQWCDPAGEWNVFFSDVVTLRDGVAAATVGGLDERLMMGFDGSGEPLFSIALPRAARATQFGEASFLTVTPDVGPVAAIDDRGQPLWQWPGQLDDGALTDHPSGLCKGDAAPAPDGELYVLTRPCAAVLALLDATVSEAASLDDTWLLARVAVDTEDGEPARCGNGWLDPGEGCDGEDFEIPETPRDGWPREAQCDSWFSGNGWTHAPSCTSECEVDLSACESTCGNGELDENEGCDGDMFRHAQSCDDAMLGSGPLGCNECEVDLSVCPMRASCGNGQLEDWETCDGNLSREPRSCEEAGLPGVGLIMCSADCNELDYSACDG